MKKFLNFTNDPGRLDLAHEYEIGDHLPPSYYEHEQQVKERLLQLSQLRINGSVSDKYGLHR